MIFSENSILFLSQFLQTFSRFSPNLKYAKGSTNIGNLPLKGTMVFWLLRMPSVIELMGFFLNEHLTKIHKNNTIVHNKSNKFMHRKKLSNKFMDIKIYLGILLQSSLFQLYNWGFAKTHLHFYASFVRCELREVFKGTFDIILGVARS